MRDFMRFCPSVFDGRKRAVDQDTAPVWNPQGTKIELCEGLEQKSWSCENLLRAHIGPTDHLSKDARIRGRVEGSI